MELLKNRYVQSKKTKLQIKKTIPKVNTKAATKSTGMQKTSKSSPADRQRGNEGRHASP